VKSVSRIRRFSVGAKTVLSIFKEKRLGKAFVANDIICYGDDDLMFSSICVKEA